GVALEGSAQPSLRLESGSFQMVEEIWDVPGRDEPQGPFKLVLALDKGRISISSTDETVDADVVVSLGYESAAAMSRGDLDPIDAIGCGQVKVRGDLSLLLAAQSLFAVAGERGASMLADTTY
ncbi:MAG: SCP2 sterol-binding domain-containing protein, partial [Acidimicrobiales bacterium]